ncbi:hypothetical protein [Burkholderia cenocepacia]|uniref:hypothetical protein n=1 Tax=Burkholderia cenocepacia TaxID=95486 RepID=UPI00286FAD32|nr:hypothetical protein [Burkholderia cenocepacia]
MKAPVNEMLVTDIAGRVAVVVTELTAAADVLKQLASLDNPIAGNARSQMTMTARRS